MLCRMPKPDRHAHERRAAVRHERQRDAGDRHDPHHHPDVDDELEQDHRGHPGREHRAERVARPPAGDEDPPQEQREQDEQHQAADEPELLGEHGEHEVGRLDRQEVALRLRAVGQAASEPPARADRDLRLIELVAGARDVRVRVEERGQSFLLVVAQDVGPRDRDHRDDRRGQRTEPHEARTRHPEHAGQDRREHERRAEVGLEHDQDQRRPDEHARPEDRPQASRAWPGGWRGSSASTMIIRILASSLNWNVNGPNVIQRADPPTPSPIASVSTSRPSWSAYTGQDSVLNQR